MRLVINTGRPVAVVARELGVTEQTLGRWVNLFKSRQDAAWAYERVLFDKLVGHGGFVRNLRRQVPELIRRLERANA